MKVLIINIDKSIFEPNSKSLERLREYSQFCEKLFVVVFTLKKYETIKIGNLIIFPTNSKNRISYFKNSFQLAKKIINEEKIDLIMTQDPFDTGIIGWLLKRKFKIPWQCQIHTDFLSPYFKKESLMNRLRTIVGKILIKKANNIRMVSQRIKNSLIKIGIPEFKIINLPIISNIKSIENAPININLKQKYPQFQNILLVASRLSKEKNIGLIIKSMPAVLKNNPETGLIIVGEGPEKNNLKLQTTRLPSASPQANDGQANYKLQANIIFEPWTNDLASYYKTADIFILTSNYEGWSMAIIEAVASGCPIIMTDVGCAGEIIKNNESGIVIPVQNQKKLEEAIGLLLVDKNLRIKLSENAKKSILKLPSQEEYLEIYKKSWAALIK